MAPCSSRRSPWKPSRARNGGSKRGCSSPSRVRRHGGIRRPGLERLHLHLERRPDRRRTRRHQGRGPRIPDQGRRRRTKAEVALPEPGGMHHVPHRHRQVRPRRQHRPDEPRPRLRRRGRQPARHARTHRPVRPEAAEAARRSWRSSPTTAIESRPRRPRPGLPARQLQPLPPQVGRRKRRVPVALTRCP